VIKLSKKGILYVVGTPIGNLGDISIRAKEVLGQVSFVAAEDTRVARKLLTHLGLKISLLSCHSHNERISAQKIINYLEKGMDVALVSDAGTPALSDPGISLIKIVRDAGFQVTPIPGASAIITALSIAAMPANSFFFAGFLPKRPIERRKALAQLKGIPHTLVVFETPHRLLNALEDIKEILGNRYMVMARELTKVHETVMCGLVSDVINRLLKTDVKGEITLVIKGSEEADYEVSGQDFEKLKKVLQYMISEKSLSVRDGVDLLSQLTGIARSQIYSLALKIKQKDRQS
jgi:16S rRNA (cytidine1402-2'-O)-methyltransferase